jgi:hypothetical protein
MKSIITLSILAAVVLFIRKISLNKTKALFQNDIIYLEAFISNCELTKDNYYFIISEFIHINEYHYKNSIRISLAFSAFRKRFGNKTLKFGEDCS